jgi:hypothetical protein
VALAHEWGRGHRQAADPGPGRAGYPASHVVQWLAIVVIVATNAVSVLAGREP